MSIGIEATRNDNYYIYKSCVLGRQLAKLYNRYLLRGRYKIDVIYVDVVYLPIESFDGCKYFVTIIDDFTQ